MKDIANSFILLLIFVFDPLAIMLVIATNQAFEQNKPKLNIYGEIKEPENLDLYSIEDAREFTDEPPVKNTHSETASQVKKILFDNDDNSITY